MVKDLVTVARGAEMSVGWHRSWVLVPSIISMPQRLVLGFHTVDFA